MIAKTVTETDADALVEKIAKLFRDGKIDTKAVNFLKGLPSMVRQNGLGQTLAFLQSKKPEYKFLLSIMVEFLFGQEDTGKFIKTIQEDMSIDEYVHLQKVALRYAEDMKKFAVALHKEVIHATPAS